MNIEPFQRDPSIDLPAKRAAIEARLRRLKQWIGALVVCFVSTLFLDMQGSNKKESRPIAFMFLVFYVLLLLSILCLGALALWKRAQLREVEWQIEEDRRARASLGDIFKRE